MTVLNFVLNVILIRGLGPIPSFGTAGAAMGTAIGVGSGGRVLAVEALERRLGRVVSARSGVRAGLAHHQVPVSIRVADGHSGHRDERRRRVHAGVHRIASAERGGSGGIRRVLHAAVLADHMDLRRADGRGRGGRGTESRRGPSRSRRRGGACGRAFRVRRRRRSSVSSFSSFRGNCWPSSA